MAARIAERKVVEEKTRNSALLDDVSRRSNHHSRDAVLLEVATDQTHGLVADGSERNEQRDIDFIFTTACKNFRRILFNGATL